MLLLSLLRLRVPPRILFHMPPVAIVATGTVGVPPRRSGRTRTVVNYARQMAAEEHERPVDLGAESPLTDLEPEEIAEPKKKRKRMLKVVEPVVYDIPPVEIKTTSFKGMDGASTRAYLRVYK
jgi:hypothetical protein